MALTKPRDYQTYADLAAKNLTAGEGSSAAKRVDGAFFDANNEEANEALAVRAAWGADFTDAGSDAANGYYTITTGIVDAEHYVVISDGTNVWKVQAFADDEVKITDSEIVNGGAGPADYSSSAFIASLHLWVDKTTKAGIFVDATQVVLDEDAPNALTGENIKRAAGESSDLDADLTTVETAFAAEHNGSTGAHDSSFLTSAMLDTDEVFTGEGFVNFIRNGSFERWPQGPDNAPDSEGWDEDSATVARSTTAAYGNYAARIAATAANRGIKYEVDDYANYAGRTVTVSALVKQNLAGDVEIRIDDGVGTTTGTAVTLDATWQVVSCTRAVDSGATELTVYIVSSGGSAAWYLDSVMGAVGDTVLSYGKSVHDHLADDNVVPVNWLLNPGFEQWAIQNTLTHPDYWPKYGIGTVSVSSSNTAFGGRASAALTSCQAMTGITQHIGEFSEVNDLLAGKTVCFSAWLRLAGAPAANTWRIELYDGSTATATSFEASDLSDGEWTQLAVVADLRSAMSDGDLECRIYAVDGETGDNSLYIDGACLNVGSRPMPGAGYADAPSIWNRESFTFQYAGELSGDAYVGLLHPVPRWFFPTRMDVYCGQGPGHGVSPDTADYILYRGSFGAAPSAGNLTAQLVSVASPDADGAGSSATNTLADANTDQCNEGDYIRVYQDLGPNVDDNPEDITVIVTGYSFTL